MVENATTVHEVYSLPDGYSRSKAPSMIPVRDMTREEGLTLRAGQQVYFRSVQGTLRHAKVNGAVRTWKHDPNRIKIPIKHGMYEHATMGWDGRVYHSPYGESWLVVPQ